MSDINQSGVVRHFDALGRIVIPAEMRIKLGWVGKFEVYIDCHDDCVVLSAYQNKCCVCNKKERLQEIINDKFICPACLEKLKKYRPN